jgi:hypothetical protein
MMYQASATIAMANKPSNNGDQSFGNFTNGSSSIFQPIPNGVFPWFRIARRSRSKFGIEATAQLANINDVFFLIFLAKQHLCVRKFN